MDYLVPISRFPDFWRFLLISMAALIGVLITASLGFWQLDRAAQKQAIFDAITRQQAQQPWHNAQLAAQVPVIAEPMSEVQQADLLHRPVQLQGQWLAEQTLFLDNRQMQGKAGFYVLTPFRLNAPYERVVVIVQCASRAQGRRRAAWLGTTQLHGPRAPARGADACRPGQHRGQAGGTAVQADGAGSGPWRGRP